MNCHRARQLISPYLDHQLSGREKLTLQDHLAVCASCDQERQSLRQVKMLLRGLAAPRLPGEFGPSDFSQRFSATVSLRLEQPESRLPGWRVMHLTSPRPQRGRRLATALALSCLTVVSFALPFAPEARLSEQSAAASGGPVFPVPASTDALLSGQPPERILMVSPASPAGFSVAHSDTLTLADTATSSFGFRAQDASLGSSQFAVFRPR